MTGAELDSSSEKTTERSVLRLFSPLTAIMYAKDDWGELEECSEELFPSELCSYETEILEQIAKEYLLEEGDRGLAVYLDIPELEEKIYSMKLYQTALPRMVQLETGQAARSVLRRI